MANRLIMVLLSSFVLSLPVQAEQLRIAVAANFRSTLELLVADYLRAEPGADIRLSSASSGTLYTQIVNGAPFDLFMSADSQRPLQLDALGLSLPESRFTYAEGQLALWHTGEQPLNATELVQWTGRLAVANPRLAPYGLATQQVLEQLGLWQVLRPQMLTGSSITQAYQYVYSGNAPLGFVSYAQIKDGMNKGVFSGSYWLVPAELSEPIDQQALILKRTQHVELAQSFTRYLKTPAAAEIIRQAGYLLPG